MKLIILRLIHSSSYCVINSKKTHINNIISSSVFDRTPQLLPPLPLLQASAVASDRTFSSAANNNCLNNGIKMADKDLQITAKVQLHVHMDGAIRIKSILPIAKKRGITLPCDSYDELYKKVVMQQPETLTEFLARFVHWMPALVGDLDAITQLAEEFAEDMALDNVIYCEARYCPHLLLGDTLTPDQVVEAVNSTFAAAEKKHNIKLRSILCCMRHMPELSSDILRLCEKYRDQGVVAIDIAGDENLVETSNPTQKEHIEVFQRAKEKGIRRTVHAGENGPAAVVREALDEMYADRIGHGYRVVTDDNLYRRMIRDRIHFETCPWSSILSGACVPDWNKHSIKRFAQDDANFSLNTDDPTVTQTSLSKEHSIVEKELGVSKLRLIKCNFDAARSAFLPESEKKEVLDRLHKEYAHIKETHDF